MLIGRDAELAVLDSLAARAAAGAGGVVLVSGEPGVGKTRLAREAAGRACGAAVSWGACRECEGAPPLWPRMQVLGSRGGATVTSQTADGPAARFQLFERIGHGLRESAAATPQLVVVDDLHRADEASLRLLAYLSERPDGGRPTQRPTRSPLQPALAARGVGHGTRPCPAAEPPSERAGVSLNLSAGRSGRGRTWPCGRWRRCGPCRWG